MSTLQQLGAEQILVLIFVAAALAVGTVALGGNALGWGR